MSMMDCLWSYFFYFYRFFGILYCLDFFFFVYVVVFFFFFFFSSRRRHTRWNCDWSSDVCSSDLHPNWSMGAKISVDSATLINKGLELIEAHYLFGLPSERIDILIHPQSVIHSMVEFVDASVLAQLGSPDMRIPIAYALAWPERLETPAQRLDLAAIARLDFEKPDTKRFPALRLAREALEEGAAAPIVLNAANEVAVASFLAGAIRFSDITSIVEEALSR